MRSRVFVTPGIAIAVFGLTMFSAAAQDSGLVKTIQDVKVGMSRSVVLAGLADRYAIRKIGTRGTWLFYGKDPNHFEQAEIWFWQDKVSGIYVNLYPPMEGEAVQLVEHLFFLLRDRAPATPPNPVTLQIFKDSPPPPEVMQSYAEGLANNRHLDLPVDLHYRRGDKQESMEIDFTIGKEHFSIEAFKLEGFPAKAEIKQNIDPFLDTPK